MPREYIDPEEWVPDPWDEDDTDEPDPDAAYDRWRDDMYGHNE